MVKNVLILGALGTLLVPRAGLIAADCVEDLRPWLDPNSKVSSVLETLGNGKLGDVFRDVPQELRNITAELLGNERTVAQIIRDKNLAGKCILGPRKDPILKRIVECAKTNMDMKQLLKEFSLYDCATASESIRKLADFLNSIQQGQFHMTTGQRDDGARIYSVDWELKSYVSWLSNEELAILHNYRYVFSMLVITSDISLPLRKRGHGAPLVDRLFEDLKRYLGEEQTHAKKSWTDLGLEISLINDTISSIPWKDHDRIQQTLEGHSVCYMVVPTENSLTIEERQVVLEKTFQPWDIPGDNANTDAYRNESYTVLVLAK